MLEKWSINRLSEEAGMDRRTIKKRLEQVEPCDFQDGDPVYRLRDFIGALLGHDKDGASNLEAEKTRLTKAQADQAELNLSVSRKEVVPVDIAFQVVSNMFFSVRRIVETSGLVVEEKDEIFEQLRGLQATDFVNEVKFEEGEEK
jgi:phage terminase Nu1 subunit (DNA packaging protein)